MKVRCLFNTGKRLRFFEYDNLADENVFGRFGTSELTEFEITIGKDYLVMGIIIFETYQGYLIDDNQFITVCPCQLFEVLDEKISTNWQFRLINKGETIYPYVQAIFGYPELCNEVNSYENLIVERDALSYEIYFKRKLEFEQ